MGACCSHDQVTRNSRVIEIHHTHLSEHAQKNTHEEQQRPQRITHKCVLIGRTGEGKTTLRQRLAMLSNTLKYNDPVASLKGINDYNYTSTCWQIATVATVLTALNNIFQVLCCIILEFHLKMDS